MWIIAITIQQKNHNVSYVIVRAGLAMTSQYEVCVHVHTLTRTNRLWGGKKNNAYITSD